MIDTEYLANAYRVNIGIINRQTDGLTHEDSLLQPPFRGNCLNWVLGHILVNRNRILKLLGEPPVVKDAVIARYETASDPITGHEDGILSLDELITLLNRSQEAVTAGLQRMIPEDLQEEIEVNGQVTTPGKRLFGLYFHETYHTGQTELLRQLAGTDDKVI